MNELGHAAHAHFQGRQGLDISFLRCGDRLGINRLNKSCGVQLIRAFLIRTKWKLPLK